MAQRRKKREIERKDGIKIDDEDYIDESGDDLLTQRRRSQGAKALKMSHKKQDFIVLLMAAIIIAATLGGYLYYNYALDSGDVDEEADLESVRGNITAELFVNSDINYTWGEKSWHLMNINGETSFMLKTENTGDLVDSYELSDNNVVDRIYIQYSKNNFKLKPNEATLIILKVTTSLDYPFRMPSPIEITLKSKTLKSIMM